MQLVDTRITVRLSPEAYETYTKMEYGQKQMLCGPILDDTLSLLKEQGAKFFADILTKKFSLRKLYHEYCTITPSPTESIDL